MSPNKSTSTIRLWTFGLLISFLWVGIVHAAPVYRGQFTLPHTVRWGQAVLPAGDYLLRFEDLSNARIFVVIQDLKRHQDVAFVPAMTVDGAEGKSALLLVNDGSQWVVQSLRLSELGVVFNYELAPVRETKGIEEARTTQASPVTVAKK